MLEQTVTPKEYYYLYKQGRTKAIAKSCLDIHKGSGDLEVYLIKDLNGNSRTKWRALTLECYRKLSDPEIIAGKMLNWENFK